MNVQYFGCGFLSCRLHNLWVYHSLIPAGVLHLWYYHEEATFVFLQLLGFGNQPVERHPDQTNPSQLVTCWAWGCAGTSWWTGWNSQICSSEWDLDLFGKHPLHFQCSGVGASSQAREGWKTWCQSSQKDWFCGENGGHSFPSCIGRGEEENDPCTLWWCACLGPGRGMWRIIAQGDFWVGSWECFWGQRVEEAMLRPLKPESHQPKPRQRTPIRMDQKTFHSLGAPVPSSNHRWHSLDQTVARAMQLRWLLWPFLVWIHQSSLRWFQIQANILGLTHYFGLGFYMHLWISIHHASHS